MPPAARTLLQWDAQIAIAEVKLTALRATSDWTTSAAFLEWEKAERTLYDLRRRRANCAAFAPKSLKAEVASIIAHYGEENR